MSSKKKFETLAGQNDNEYRRTFILNEEGHTLGNALRSMLMKNPAVVFCGYTIPHPSEYKLHFRVETKGITAKDAFKKGLEDLLSLCDHVSQTFQTELDACRIKQEME